MDSSGFCFVCFTPHNSLKTIATQDNDGVSIQDKLNSFIPDNVLFRTKIPKYICANCLEIFRNIYKFREKCLENIVALNEYIQTLPSNSFKYSFETLAHILQFKMLKMCETNDCSPREDAPKDLNVEKDVGVHFLSTGDLAGASSVQTEKEIITPNSQPVLFEQILREEKDVEEENDLNNEEIDNNDDSLQQSIPELKTQMTLFKCSECPKAFVKAKDFRRHKRNHEKAFVCNICFKNFTSSSHVRIHKRTHTGVKPYLCDICNKTFSTSGYLQIHRRTHTGEKPYTCDICQKSFCASTDLNSHKRIHNNDRPYQCVVCLKSFTQTGHLSRHMLTHSGEKPYECEKCEYKCSDSSNLRKHISRTHTDN